MLPISTARGCTQRDISLDLFVHTYSGCSDQDGAMNWACRVFGPDVPPSHEGLLKGSWYDEVPRRGTPANRVQRKSSQMRGLSIEVVVESRGSAG